MDGRRGEEGGGGGGGVGAGGVKRRAFDDKGRAAILTSRAVFPSSEVPSGVPSCRLRRALSMSAGGLRGERTARNAQRLGVKSVRGKEMGCSPEQ